MCTCKLNTQNWWAMGWRKYYYPHCLVWGLKQKEMPDFSLLELPLVPHWFGKGAQEAWLNLTAKQTRWDCKKHSACMNQAPSANTESLYGPRSRISVIRIQISEKCLNLQIPWHLKWGRAVNHTCKYRHPDFCSTCLDPHENTSLYIFLWLQRRKQRFVSNCVDFVVIWSEEIKSLQCLNSDLLLGIPMDWFCISYY